jgi:hypothetical protein
VSAAASARAAIFFRRCRNCQHRGVLFNEAYRRDVAKTDRVTPASIVPIFQETPVKSILVLLASTILIAACSPQSDIQNSPLPTSSPMHIRALDRHPEVPYVVRVWGVPINDEFATD